MPGVNRLFIGASRRSLHAGSSGGLGPNLITAPNGPFNAAPWSLGNTVLSGDRNQTDPQGGSTASLLADNVTSAQHYILTGVSVTNAQKYRVQMYIKPGTWTGIFCLTFQPGTGNASVDFDLTAHTGASSGGSPTNIQMTAVANGFYLCQYDIIAGQTNASANIAHGFGSGVATYAGTGSNVTIWGSYVGTTI